MMLYHADLVSAIRLPNNLFTENANTEVGSDLIILQKNTQKESLRGDDNLLDTVYHDENRIPTNNYFLEHPQRTETAQCPLPDPDRAKRRPGLGGIYARRTNPLVGKLGVFRVQLYAHEMTPHL